MVRVVVLNDPPARGFRTVSVFGEAWDKSARDISIGGLGWVGVGVSGNASFRVWTHVGVQVETRESLVPDMAGGSFRTTNEHSTDVE